MDQLDATVKRERTDVPLVLGSRSHCLVGGTGGGNSLMLNQALLALLTQHIHNCLCEVADGMGSAGVEQCVHNYLKVQCSPSYMSGDCVRLITCLGVCMCVCSKCQQWRHL